VRLGEREQVVVGRAAGVDRARLEQRADLVERRGVVAVGLAVDGDVAGARAVEPEDQAHRRRLARAVRAEEARHDPGLDGERRVPVRRLSAMHLESEEDDACRSVALGRTSCLRPACFDQTRPVLAETGIRVLRERPVFTTPNVFPPVGFEQADVG
jgi:hypothetical protein